jgi:hypothetical protein
MLRLNLDSTSQALTEEKHDEVLAFIRTLLAASRSLLPPSARRSEPLNARRAPGIRMRLTANIKPSGQHATGRRAF